MKSLAFSIIKRLISQKFESVTWLTTNELAQWLADPIKPQPLILDARSEVEYALSHLKQAKRIDPYHPNLDGLCEFKDKPIVVYCSVGYRSASVAQELGKAGFLHVYNLEGSIFQWANEDRPVFKNSSPTKLIHPYNSRWGRLLKPEYRALVN